MYILSKPNLKFNFTKKHAKALLMLLTALFIIIIIAIVGLLNQNKTEHEHTFSDEYTCDELYHWKEATCEHTNLIQEKELHNFNADLICTICEYQKVLSPDIDDLEDLKSLFDQTLINTSVLMKDDNSEEEFFISEDAIKRSAKTHEYTVKFYETYYEIYYMNSAELESKRIEESITIEQYLKQEKPELYHLMNALKNQYMKFVYNEENQTLSMQNGEYTDLSNEISYANLNVEIQLENKSMRHLTATFQWLYKGSLKDRTVLIGFGNIPAIEPPKPTTNLAYEMLETGTYTITGIGKSEDTTIIIPEMINGILVTNISASAFKNTNIQRLTVPGTVKTIGDSAFEGCKQLSYIELQDGVEVIGKRAFAYGNDLSEIHMHDSIKIFGDDAFLRSENYAIKGEWYYYGDINIYAMSVIGQGEATPASTHDMYVNRNVLRSVKLNSATYISPRAFRFLETPREYYLGKQITQIGEFALSGMPVEGTGIHRKFAPYKVYYDGTMEQWIDIQFDANWAVGHGYDLYINETKVTNVYLKDIETVPANIFSNCTSIATLHLEEGIKHIEAGAFKYCNLINISIPSTLESVAATAFVIDFSRSSIDALAFIDNGQAYFLGPPSNPYYICIEIYEDVFEKPENCKIIAQ